MLCPAFDGLSIFSKTRPHSTISLTSQSDCIRSFIVVRSLSLALVALAMLPVVSFAADIVPLKGLDPVELSAGKEVAGKDSITAKAGRFTYQFANEANKSTFLAAPEKYGIQFGGACMKMGPLSGYGSPERWDVYDGRIYLFASESCRNAFRADQKKFIDTVDETPKGTDAQKKTGAELMAKAVAAAGGEKRLKELKTYQVKTKLTQPLRDGKSFVYHRTFAASFKDPTAAEWESYDNVKYGWVYSPKVAYRTSSKEWEEVDTQVRDFMAREVARKPLWLLVAWLNGSVQAITLGKDTIGDTPIEQVSVSLNGATTTLNIDPKTGSILSSAYRGRAAVGISNVVRIYSDFKVVNGVTVPFTVNTKIDGKLVEGVTKAEIESITIDEAIPADLIKKP
jgi:YHS domain-containing protein